MTISVVSLFPQLRAYCRTSITMLASIPSSKIFLKLHLFPAIIPLQTSANDKNKEFYTIENNYKFYTSPATGKRFFSIQPDEWLPVSNPVPEKSGSIGYRQVNLEMQVVNYHDWSERSLNYLCRLFNNLNKGNDYCATLPAIQIGILDFTPFPENPNFYSKNLMMDTETHHVYSSKFAIHVLDLKQINNASSEDKHWGLDNWAKLFKATTWEDVKMIAANNKYLTEAANTMHELYSDREMRRQKENREDFICRQKRDQRMLKDQADIIAEKDSALARQADEIAKLQAQIESLKKSL